MRLSQLTTTIGIPTLFAAIALFTETRAYAQTIHDPKTGLTVTTPPGYSSFGIEYEKVKDNPKILLKSNYMKDSYCHISYSKFDGPVNQQYDAMAQNWNERSRDYAVHVRKVIGARPQISNMPKFDENYPLRPPNRSFPGRELSVLFKTSNGYLDVRCQSLDEDFDKVRPVLQTIIGSISFSR